MPVREVEVRSLYQVVAAHDLSMGSMVTKDDVKLVAVAGEQPGREGLHDDRERAESRPDRRGARERAAVRVEGGAARSGRRPAAVDHRGHARRLGEGQRSRLASPASSCRARTWT